MREEKHDLTPFRAHLAASTVEILLDHQQRHSFGNSHQPPECPIMPDVVRFVVGGEMLLAVGRSSLGNS